MHSTGYAIRLDYSPTPLDGDATVVDVLRQMLVTGAPDKGGFGVEELRQRIHILKGIDAGLTDGSAELRLSADAWTFLCELAGACTFSEARPVFLAAVDAVLGASGTESSEAGVVALRGGAS